MTKGRFNATKSQYEHSPDIDLFLDEVIAVCRKHNMAIGHEDSQGSFLVSRGFDEKSAEVLRNALICT